MPRRHRLRATHRAKRTSIENLSRRRDNRLPPVRPPGPRLLPAPAGSSSFGGGSLGGSHRGGGGQLGHPSVELGLVPVLLRRTGAKRSALRPCRPAQCGSGAGTAESTARGRFTPRIRANLRIATAAPLSASAGGKGSLAPLLGLMGRRRSQRVNACCLWGAASAFEEAGSGRNVFVSLR